MMTFKPCAQTVFLKEGDIAEIGDAYDLGNGHFAVVGNDPPDTWMRPGDPWPAQCMCYRPRRNPAPWPGHSVPTLAPLSVTMDSKGFRST